ncbi:MAG: winged helix-turn-helix transcriptional regulator [Woeseiaceae bacterium]|nr:winged helix-turn-helix transcriptional regulator [Woeseiaceae bacterium]
MTPAQDQIALRPLIDLAHHRWNIPVIAELHRQSGAKFITLANTVGVSRNSLSTSLNDLIELGLVMKNPGYGHPMRPEYLLTQHGEAIGERCLQLATLLNRRHEVDVGFRKWTLPLVVAIGEGVQRFSEVRASLGDLATPRAVTLGLKSMLSADWATRSVIDDYPPRAGYSLTPKGHSVYVLADGICS